MDDCVPSAPDFDCRVADLAPPGLSKPKDLGCRWRWLPLSSGTSSVTLNCGLSCAIGQFALKQSICNYWLCAIVLIPEASAANWGCNGAARKILGANSNHKPKLVQSQIYRFPFLILSKFYLPSPKLLSSLTWWTSSTRPDMVVQSIS